MKKILSILLLLSALLLVSCRDSKTLIMGTVDYMPPFAYIGGENNDELMGFDIEFGRSIAKELNKDLKIEVMRFDQLLPAIIDGKIDIALASIFVTEERQKIVNMSSPYYESYQVVIVREDDKTFENIETEQELGKSNKRLSSQLNSAGMTAAASIAGNNPVLGFNSVELAIEQLLKNNVDAIITDRMRAIRYLENYDNLAILPDISFFKRYYGVAISQKNNTLLNHVNNAITKSISSGEYMEWVKTYMGYN